MKNKATSLEPDMHDKNAMAERKSSPQSHRLLVTAFLGVALSILALGVASCAPATSSSDIGKAPTLNQQTTESVAIGAEKPPTYAALLVEADEDRKAGLLKEALAKIKRVAEAGVIEGLAEYGFYLWDGIGCTADKPTAITWFHRAADHGHINAMYQLGYAYLNGEGTAKDEAKGIAWMTKSAEGNCPLAQTEMGRQCYNAGKKVEARSWLTLGASNGVVHAQYNLALMCESGDGGPTDSKQARTLYHSAAMRGHAMAAANLGAMHMEGKGGPVDFAEAAKWCMIAKQLNSELMSPEANLKRLRQRFDDVGWNRVVDRAIATYKQIR